jgi:hypothetical protein
LDDPNFQESFRAATVGERLPGIAESLFGSGYAGLGSAPWACGPPKKGLLVVRGWNRPRSTGSRWGWAGSRIFPNCRRRRIPIAHPAGGNTTKRLARRLLAGEWILSFVPEAEPRAWRMMTRGKHQLVCDRVRPQNPVRLAERAATGCLAARKNRRRRCGTG